MIFKELYIGAFGGLSDRRFVFSEGINLIEGQNESGKSTLCAFIKFIFFGLPAKGKNTAMPDRKRYLPFDAGSAHGTLTLSYEGRDYRIARTLTMTGKTAARDEYTVTDLSSGERVFEDMPPCEVFLGMNESVFVRTAYVSQLHGAAVGGTEIGTAIENLLFSAEEEIDSAKVLKALDAARAGLLHKNAKGGRLYDAQCERDALAARLREAQGAGEQVRKIEEKLEDLRKSESENARLTEEAEQNLTRYESAERLLRFAEAAELENRLRALRDKRESQFPAGELPSSEDIHALIRLSAAIRESEPVPSDDVSPEPPPEHPIERDGGAERVTARLRSVARRAKTCRAVGAVFAFLTLVLFGVAVTLALQTEPFISLLESLHPLLTSPWVFAAGAFAAGVCAILLFAAGAKAAGRLRDLLTEYGVNSIDEVHICAERARDDGIFFREQLRSREARREREQAEQATRIARAKTLCARFGRAYEGPDALETLAARLTTIRESCTVLDGQIARAEQDLRQLRGLLAEWDEQALRDALGGDPQQVMRSLDPKELKNRVAFGSVGKENIRAKIVELEKTLIELRARAQDEQQLEERLRELGQEIDALTLRCDALRLAYEKMEQASEAVKEHISPALARRAGQLLKQATGGKYDTLWISPDLSITYTDRAHGDAVRDTEYLSRGTRDLVYIALRIALCEQLCPGKSLPMIFDESFAAMDDARLSKIYAVIAERGAQSLIFTSGHRDRALLPECNLIKLD